MGLAMASSTRVYTLCVLLVCICSLQIASVGADNSDQCSCDICFTVYRHEIRGGENQTVLLGPGANPAGWGSLIVYDDSMKAGTASSSTLLGKMTGQAARTTKDGRSVQTIFEHVFGPGSEYNGSSLTVIGLILFQNLPWELIVAGGTGNFRGYSGYAVANPIPSATVGSGPGQLVVSEWDLCLFKSKKKF